MKNTPPIIFALILLSSVLLNGCVLLTHPPGQAQPVRNPAILTHWKTQGSLSVQSQQGGVIGHFQWTQAPQAYQLALSGPLGMHAMAIHGTPKQVTLSSAKTGQVTAKNLQQLMHQQLGWSLPLKEATFWVRGLPAPDMPYRVQYDQQGHMAQLWQGGWSIQLSGYRFTQGFELPYKISLHQGGAHQQGLTARLAIRRWGFPS
jgi:outer membrane lipoprotein LolB